MNEKSLNTEINLNQTPNFRVSTEKQIKPKEKQAKKVDINVLKSRVQEMQNRENKKNIIIFIFLLLVLVVLGFYFSL